MSNGARNGQDSFERYLRRLVAEMSPVQRGWLAFEVAKLAEEKIRRTLPAAAVRAGQGRGAAGE